ncbi:MAG: glycosyl hydrolase family 95 catalytic domain-containing protein [[Eubacterium] siraeum]
MRESVRFYTQWLIYDDKQKRLVSSPTYSPEHGPVTIGNTYEQSLIEQLYNDFITASEALGTDEELRNIVKNQVVQLKPFSISKKTGLLKEWFEEDDDNFDHSKTQKNHRHISHLLGLYPGNAINSNTPELMTAAINTLNDRGDESTGWARAYKLNLWARVKDGNRAYSILQGLLRLYV